MANNRPKLSSKMLMYIVCHLRAAIGGLGKLLREPFSNFMIIAVIAIAIALPLSFYQLLQNVQLLSSSWSSNSTAINLYLKNSVSDSQAQDLLRILHSNPEIASVKYISAQQGLQEFKNILGTQQALQELKFNPLPKVIVVNPVFSIRSSLKISQLLDSLRSMSEVDTAQLNMHWLQRLNSIIDLLQQVVFVFAMLLAMGVLLIIGNTIHLAIKDEFKEIELLKLIGGTNAFIRRPFLYIGAWYGLLGGVFAWIIVTLILNSLQEPVTQLANSYNSDFYLHTLNTHAAVAMLISSMFLGFCSSWIASSRSLRRIH